MKVRKRDYEKMRLYKAESRFLVFSFSRFLCCNRNISTWKYVILCPLTIMECPRCGKKLEPNAKFCEECGLKISDVDTSYQTQVPPIFSQPYQPPIYQPPVMQPTTNIPQYSQREEWWNSLWFALILTFVCGCTPLGIILYWLNPVAPKKNKITFTLVIAGIWLFSIIFFVLGSIIKLL